MSGRSVILSTLFLGKLPQSSLPVLSAHLFAINSRMLFLNQRKRKNGRRNIFMTKSSRKDVPDARVDRGAYVIIDFLLSNYSGELKETNVCHNLSIGDSVSVLFGLAIVVQVHSDTTVMIQSFRTNMSGQTVHTQIRLLLEEQSDQGLHCLLFHLHLFDKIP